MGCVAIVVVKATGLACRTVPWMTSLGVMSCGGPGHMACWKRSRVSPLFLSLSPGTFRKGHKTVSLLRITFLKWSQTIWWIFIVEYSPMSVFLEIYPHPRFPPLFWVNQAFFFIFWLPEYSLMISLSTPPPSSKRLWPKTVFLGTWDTIFLNLEIWAESNSQDLRSEGQQKECGVEPRWPGFQSQLSGPSSVLPDKLLKLSDIQFHFEIGEVILYLINLWEKWKELMTHVI